MTVSGACEALELSVAAQKGVAVARGAILKEAV